MWCRCWSWSCYSRWQEFDFWFIIWFLTYCIWFLTDRKLILGGQRIVSFELLEEIGVKHWDKGEIKKVRIPPVASKDLWLAFNLNIKASFYEEIGCSPFQLYAMPYNFTSIDERIAIKTVDVRKNNVAAWFLQVEFRQWFFNSPSRYYLSYINQQEGRAVASYNTHSATSTILL